jgi:hypothetical protein
MPNWVVPALSLIAELGLFAAAGLAIVLGMLGIH